MSTPKRPFLLTTLLILLTLLSPMSFSGAELSLDRPAPKLGEHDR